MAEQSLISLANFEQKVILQPIYDNSYSVVSNGGASYNNTLRQALKNTSYAAKLMPDFSPVNPESVNVLGTVLNFQGNDLGNVPQRMDFIKNIASEFTEIYNKPSGIEQIIDWHKGLTQPYYNKAKEYMNDPHGYD